MVRHGGDLKVAQYGQWDGYPSGQGVKIAEFVQSELLRADTLAAFTAKVDNCTWATADDIQATWTACGADPESDFVSFDIGDVHRARFPQFSRDTSADILMVIHNNGGMPLHDQRKFMNDGLFCEWAYLINLDDGHVYVLCPENYAKGYLGCKKIIARLPFADCTMTAMLNLDKTDDAEEGAA